MKTRSVGDAARRLGVDRVTVYAWMARDILAFELVDGKKRPVASAVESLRAARALMGKKVPA